MTVSYNLPGQMFIIIFWRLLADYAVFFFPLT